MDRWNVWVSTFLSEVDYGLGISVSEDGDLYLSKKVCRSLENSLVNGL